MEMMSSLYKEFVALQAEKTKEYGYSEGLFSGNFQCVETLGSEEDREHIVGYFNAGIDDERTALNIATSFAYLGEAMGDGGIYAFLLVNDNKVIDNNPVIFFDSDGYLNVVACNFRELLTLLSIDAEPMVGYDDDENTSFWRDDEDDDHAAEHDAFIHWLDERSIPVIHDEDEIDIIANVIIANAVMKYGQALKDAIHEWQESSN